MKYSTSVSSSRRKARKAFYCAPAHIARKMMSCSLSKELRGKYNIRSIQVREGDQVKIMKGKHKGKVSKVKSSSPITRQVRLEKLSGDPNVAASGYEVYATFDASALLVIKLKMTKSREQAIERKLAARKVRAKCN